ncbi:hypothetical protein HMPREF1556_00682 [Porphyromonas sp. oral taxon 278 str. W7784]|nr:hypothetical protein HMPREF1556_00682 [Porphyromonas sp. oral taxon 278 str. W7784]
MDRRKNLLWVVSPTCRRSSRRPTVGFISRGQFGGYGRRGYTP